MASLRETLLAKVPITVPTFNNIRKNPAHTERIILQQFGAGYIDFQWFINMLPEEFRGMVALVDNKEKTSKYYQADIRKMNPDQTTKTLIRYIYAKRENDKFFILKSSLEKTINEAINRVPDEDLELYKPIVEFYETNIRK